MTLKGNTQVKVFYAEEHTTQNDVISIDKEDTVNSPQKVNNIQSLLYLLKDIHITFWSVRMTETKVKSIILSRVV